MVFGQTVRSAELTATVNALKRQKRFFPALLAPHAQCAPFMLKENVIVYTFLSENVVFPSMCIFHLEFSQDMTYI
jgi:hypothetical protein